MKKLIVALFTFGILAAASAHADVQQPVWQCALTFTASGGGVQIIVGEFRMSGPGKISCVDVAGNTQVMPVTVIMGGSVVAANAGIGYFKLAGAASGIGVASGPQDLLGGYVNAGAEVGVIVGGGANLSLHGGHSAVTLNLGLNVLAGLGLQVGITGVEIASAE